MGDALARAKELLALENDGAKGVFNRANILPNDLRDLLGDLVTRIDELQGDWLRAYNEAQESKAEVDRLSQVLSEAEQEVRGWKGADIAHTQLLRKAEADRDAALAREARLRDALLGANLPCQMPDKTWHVPCSDPRSKAPMCANCRLRELRAALVDPSPEPPEEPS